GLWHFVLILLGNIFAPYLKTVNEKLHFGPENKPFRVFQMLRTSFLVVLGEIIFRADNMSIAKSMIARIFTDFGNPFSVYYPIRNAVQTVLECANCDIWDLVISAVTVVIVFAVSLLQERGAQIRQSLSRRPVWVRWAVWYALILFIVIYGAYGVGYTPIDPMYANF
ncbi:MAG: MBOAT family protein, partial [Candidatus Faecousia sp.]|nr:MBOAT family protein [Candidatus Faecousia sp.]